MGRQILRRGIAEGTLRPDIDVEVVMAMLTGPLMARRTLRWNLDLPLEGLHERLVGAIWPAIAAG